MPRSLAVLLLLLLHTGLTVHAQRQEFSIYAGTGSASLRYTVEEGTADRGNGHHAGVGYAVHISRSLSLVSGVEYGTYMTNLHQPGARTYQGNEVDDEGEGFLFTNRVTGYREVQRVRLLSVPIAVRYEGMARKWAGWFAQAGARISVPSSSTYEATAGEVVTSGYYPDLNVTLDNIPTHGFGTFEDYRQQGPLDLKPALSVIAEAGARFRIFWEKKLFVSAFAEYGLNDLQRSSSGTSAIGYDPTGGSSPRGASMTSVRTSTGSTGLLAYGLRVRFAVNVMKKK